MSSFLFWVAGYFFTINYCKIEVDDGDELPIILISYAIIFFTWPCILGKALRETNKVKAEKKRVKSYIEK